MKKRKGRPRKLRTRRYANGRPADIPEQEREHEARRTATEARTRVFGVPPYQTANQEAGSSVGRLRLGGGLSSEQYEAALQFEKVYRDYMRALLVKPIQSAGNLDRAHGYDGADGTEVGYVQRCNAARQIYGDTRRALLEADPLALMAVFSWVIEDLWLMRMVGELRVGLNALVRLYQVDQWQSGGRLKAMV